MIELVSHSAEQTRAIAAGVATLSRAGDLIVLAGQMGAGKTAFAQGFARQLGIHEPVTSPTYTLVHSYTGASTTLHHADLYRLEHTAEVDDLAFGELLEDDAIVLVEWGDVVDLGPHLRIELRLVDDAPDGSDADADQREICITSSDKRWAPRWEHLEAAVEEWTVS
ncbi:MAG: tRNA (adenosine(37)-N6)-threonylcarbamoyltransferase complex ATPase subunit type 1 TsaE [Actinomycetota bacterium]|jgi:tRNA threonylcarbamoyladenosine biosynthesis protein TsaE